MSDREKVPVLCGVRVVTRSRGENREFINFVAVAVEFPDEIEDELTFRMAQLKIAGYWPGRFVEWEWIKYLPKTGRPACAGRFLPN